MASRTSEMNSSNSPDFIVIGAMKAGTTSLQRYLQCHPDIAMAPKELNFFNARHNLARGVDWYTAHFDSPDKLQGEISPSYSKTHTDRDLPERIHSAVPDAKIIYVVREPVARIISHLSHAVGEDTTGRSTEQIFDDSFTHFVDTSRYAMHLERYLAYFPEDRVLVIKSEALRDSRNDSLNEIFRFLDVDQSFSSDTFDQIHHDSSVKVKRNAVGRAFARYPLLRSLEQVGKKSIPSRWYPYFAKLMGRHFDKPDLNDARKAKIRDLLQQDVARLRQLTGDRFEEWGWP